MAIQTTSSTKLSLQTRPSCNGAGTGRITGFAALRYRLRGEMAAAEGRHNVEVEILKIEVEQARRPWWRRWRR